MERKSCSIQILHLCASANYFACSVYFSNATGAKARLGAGGKGSKRVHTPDLYHKQPPRIFNPASPTSFPPLSNKTHTWTLAPSSSSCVQVHPYCGARLYEVEKKARPLLCHLPSFPSSVAGERREGTDVRVKGDFPYTEESEFPKVVWHVSRNCPCLDPSSSPAVVGRRREKGGRASLLTCFFP